MNVPNVKLYFNSSDTGSEAVLAPNQHVYIDVDPKAPGVMQHLRTNGSGVIVPDPASPGAAAPSPSARSANPGIALDDSRAYNVVVSSAPLGSVPSVGTPAKVSAGKLVIAAHIAIKLTSDGSKALGGLSGQLSIGSSSTPVRSTAGGWILSSDRSDGAVTLSVTGKLASTSGSTVAKPTLSVAPLKPTRGDKAKISIASPAGAVAFKVSEWKYEISHQNPGSSIPSTASVVRPATENPATLDSAWEGLFCASGTVKVKWGAGLTLRGAGSKPVSATVVVQDAAEVTLPITVMPRSGSAWETTLAEKAEAPLNKAINTFHDTGEHKWDPSGMKVEAAPVIADGPNRGCTFLKTVNLTLTSSPFINSLLTDASSAFSKAQNTAYLTSPRPVRAIPRRLYDVGTGGAITIKNDDDFAAWILGRPLNPGENLRWMTTNHCIDQPTLLAGTRRHEYQDPDKSHKQNCLKARRALDPVKFGEALVQVPGAHVNLQGLIQARTTTVLNAAPTHDVVDEAETQKAGALRFKPGQSILGVNSDNSGNAVGPVWNPSRNTELTN